MSQPIDNCKEKKKKTNYFERLSNAITKATGTPTAFLIALVVVIIWAATGPIFHYSDT